MKILTHLKIGSRLGVGFSTILALTLLVGVFGISRLANVNENRLY